MLGSRFEPNLLCCVVADVLRCCCSSSGNLVFGESFYWLYSQCVFGLGRCGCSLCFWPSICFFFSASHGHQLFAFELCFGWRPAPLFLSVTPVFLGSVVIQAFNSLSLNFSSNPLLIFLSFYSSLIVLVLLFCFH